MLACVADRGTRARVADRGARAAAWDRACGTVARWRAVVLRAVVLRAVVLRAVVLRAAAWASRPGPVSGHRWRASAPFGDR